MDRRTLVSMMAAGVASPLLQCAAAAQPAPKARIIVLVHGLFADGSCWSEVIARLQPKGFQVTSVQNPLTTLPEAVAAAQCVLAVQQGPTVLVGHSRPSCLPASTARLSPALTRWRIIERSNSPQPARAPGASSPGFQPRRWLSHIRRIPKAIRREAAGRRAHWRASIDSDQYGLA